jgi:hypothetical protein
VISPLSLVSISVNSEIVIPSSRTRLPRTPSAKGAAIASIRATAVELSPEFRPSVSATELLVAAKDLRKQAPAHVEQLRSSRASGCGMPDIDWVQRISGRVFMRSKSREVHQDCWSYWLCRSRWPRTPAEVRAKRPPPIRRCVSPCSQACCSPTGWLVTT